MGVDFQLRRAHRCFAASLIADANAAAPPNISVKTGFSHSTITKIFLLDIIEPHPPSDAHFFSGRFDEAASAASMASQANPRFSIPWILRAAALARNGQINQSKFAAQRVLDLEPNFTINSYLAGNFTSQERLAMLGDALRQSGLP